MNKQPNQILSTNLKTKLKQAQDNFPSNLQPFITEYLTSIYNISIEADLIEFPSPAPEYHPLQNLILPPTKITSPDFITRKNQKSKRQESKPLKNVNQFLKDTTIMPRSSSTNFYCNKRYQSVNKKSTKDNRASSIVTKSINVEVDQSFQNKNQKVLDGILERHKNVGSNILNHKSHKTKLTNMVKANTPKPVTTTSPNFNFSYKENHKAGISSGARKRNNRNELSLDKTGGNNPCKSSRSPNRIFSN